MPNVSHVLSILQNLEMAPGHLSGEQVSADSSSNIPIALALQSDRVNMEPALLNPRGWCIPTVRMQQLSWRSLLHHIAQLGATYRAQQARRVLRDTSQRVPWAFQSGTRPVLSELVRPPAAWGVSWRGEVGSGLHAGIHPNAWPERWKPWTWLQSGSSAFLSWGVAN